VYLQFDQNGKRVVILNSAGDVTTAINVSLAGNFPNGLFPNGITHIELSSGAESWMTVSQLSILEPPDGRYLEGTPSP
jgi:hypothetical protein